MGSIFGRKGTAPWLTEYFDQSGGRREKSSPMTARRAAKRIAGKIEADVTLRREGVVDARHQRLTDENTPDRVKESDALS